MSDVIRSVGEQLAECEAIIERGLQAFCEVLMALLKIRNEHLYAAEYGTFHNYCHKRWGWRRRYTYYQIQAAEVMANLCTVVHKPQIERQIRPLAGLEPEQQREAWAAAVAQSANGMPTAREVEQVVREQFQPPEPTQAEVDAALRAVEEQRVEQLLAEADQRVTQLLRERREAEERAEALLKERDEIRIARHMLYTRLVEAVQTVADFHIESVADAWDGIWGVRGGKHFMENLEKAQRCLSRLNSEHPNAVRKPGIILQKPS